MKPLEKLCSITPDEHPVFDVVNGVFGGVLYKYFDSVNLQDCFNTSILNDYTESIVTLPEARERQLFLY